MAKKNINARIAAEISWARTEDRSARTRPAREAFLRRFEDEVDPDRKLPPDERARRANHALRAHMLRLRKRVRATRTNSGIDRGSPERLSGEPRSMHQDSKISNSSMYSPGR